MSKKLELPFQQHLRKIQDMKDQLYDYFRYDSKAFRAIEDYIYKHQGFNALVDHPVDHRIPCHRGTGPAINYVGASVYAMDYSVRPAKEADVYRLEINVGYVHKDEWEDEYPTERFKKFEIQVPVDLEADFTQEKFRAWIDALAEQKKKKIQAEAVKQMRKLKAEHPDLWGEI